MDRSHSAGRIARPGDAFEDAAVFTQGTPRGLFGSMGLMGDLLIIGELVAHDSSPQFGSLNHRGLARRNEAGWTLAG